MPRSGRQNAVTRRNMRREERVTIQGPVREHNQTECHTGGTPCPPAVDSCSKTSLGGGDCPPSNASSKLALPLCEGGHLQQFVHEGELVGGSEALCGGGDGQEGGVEEGQRGLSAQALLDDHRQELQDGLPQRALEGGGGGSGVRGGRVGAAEFVGPGGVRVCHGSSRGEWGLAGGGEEDDHLR